MAGFAASKRHDSPRRFGSQLRDATHRLTHRSMRRELDRFISEIEVGDHRVKDLRCHQGHVGTSNHLLSGLWCIGYETPTSSLCPPRGR